MARKSAKTLGLSTFIQNTLVEIIQGVHLAQAAVEEMETTAEICPTGLYFAKGSSPGPFKPGRGFVQEVEFDVAVTVTEAESTEGTGAGNLSIGVPTLSWLGGLSVDAGAKKGRQKERSAISRIAFRVPVLLPSELYPWNEEQQQQMTAEALVTQNQDKANP